MCYLTIEIEGYTSPRLTTQKEIERLNNLKRTEDKLSGRLSDLHLAIGEVAPMKDATGYFQEEFQKRSEEADRMRKGLKQIKEEIEATGLCIPCCGNGLDLVEECEETTVKICDYCNGTGRAPIGKEELLITSPGDEISPRSVFSPGADGIFEVDEEAVAAMEKYYDTPEFEEEMNRLWNDDD